MRANEFLNLKKSDIETIEWLIEQAEKVKQLEQIINYIKEGIENNNESCLLTYKKQFLQMSKTIEQYKKAINDPPDRHIRKDLTYDMITKKANN